MSVKGTERHSTISPDMREFLSFHFGSIEKEMEKFAAKQDKMEAALFISNGKPSMVAEISDLKRQIGENAGKINEIEAKRAKKKAETMALWVAIGIVFLTVVAPKLLVIVQKILTAVVP